jgi:glycosyltransferase involved in cell wall biosynthesis
MAKNLRIGVDATCWQNSRGYGRHARALLSALVRLDTESHYTFFIDAPANGAMLPPSVNVHRVSADAPTALAASANGHRSIRDMWRMSRAMSAGSFDVLLFPTVYSFVPVLSRSKKLVMIHDVIAETYPELTLPQLSKRLFWKIKVALGRWQADRIITVSDFSRQGIVDYFRIKPERVSVVGEASDAVFRVLENAKLPTRVAALGIDSLKRTLVYVGGFSPHKNLEVLVAVFARLAAQENFTDLRLVMVGEYKKEVFHSYYGSIKRQVEELGIEDRVVFTGYLSDEELVQLLNLSTVAVLPSLIEGFGLPAIEAAACGCPVIATSASPLPQLLGDGGLYFDPFNRDDLETALISLLESEDLRRRVREAGITAVRRLNWDTHARDMIKAIRRVVEN